MTADMGPFPKLNPEFIVRANPDVILIGQRCRWPAAAPRLAGYPAMREQRVCIFPSDEADALIRPSPRMAEGARLMARCLADKSPYRGRGHDAETACAGCCGPRCWGLAR